jgi:hypothetical protein
VERPVPALLELGRAELLLPARAQDLVALRLALAERGEDLDLGERVVERGDEGLDDRDRPVRRAQVPPALEGVGGGQVPVAALGRLVEVEAVVDAQRDLVEGLDEPRSAGAA